MSQDEREVLTKFMVDQFNRFQDNVDKRFDRTDDKVDQRLDKIDARLDKMDKRIEGIKDSTAKDKLETEKELAPMRFKIKAIARVLGYVLLAISGGGVTAYGVLKTLIGG